MKPAIDLNCDLGEREDPAGIADDLALLEFVTSVNIACGGHAGNETTMDRIVAPAMDRRVAIGAHPGYPDQKNFGRVSIQMTSTDIEALVVSQLNVMQQVVVRRGGTLHHLKPHGAFYHDAMRQPQVAEAIGDGVRRIGVPLLLIGLARAPALEVWRSMGLQVAAEAFADRRYESDGSLRTRAAPNALIYDASEAAIQALAIAQGTGIQTAGGTVLTIAADTICIHSDTPNAVQIARTVRDALKREGVRVQRP